MAEEINQANQEIKKNLKKMKIIAFEKRKGEIIDRIEIFGHFKK